MPFLFAKWMSAFVLFLSFNTHQAQAESRLYRSIDTWIQTARPEGLRTYSLSWEEGENQTNSQKNLFEGHVLHWAAAQGQIERVQAILDKGIEIDSFFISPPQTALMHAARTGQLEMVRFLLARGASPYEIDGERNSALKLALAEGHLEVARVLAAQSPDLPLCHEAKGLLIPSLLSHHDDVANYLIDQGCPTSEISIEGENSLMVAAKTGSWQVFQRLLAQGIDPQSLSQYRETLLMFAARGGHPEIVKAVLATHPPLNVLSSEDKNALVYAAEGGHLAIVKLLLAEGAVLNVKSQPAQAILQSALSSGKLELVTFLLDKGIDPTQSKQTQLAFTLEKAAFRGNAEMVRYFLKQAASSEQQNTINRQAFVAAFRQGHLDVVRLFVETGVDLNTVVGEKAQTALLRAIEDGNIPMVEYLITAGANIHVQDAEGTNALMYAAQQDHVELVEKLVLQGADIHQADQGGATALNYAFDGSRFENALFLLQKGASSQVLRPEDQSNLLEWAAQNGDLALLQTVIDYCPALKKNSELQRPALLAAATSGQMPLLRFFFDQGLRIQSPQEVAYFLRGAAFAGDIETVVFLLAQGASLSPPPDGAEDVLLLAASQGHTDMVAFLLGQDPERNRAHLNLALAHAANRGHVGLATWLLQQGAEPLHDALLSPSYRMLETLLAHGANPNLGEKDLRPLFVASEISHYPLAKLLLEKGAESDFEALEMPFAAWVALRGELPLLKLLHSRGLNLQQPQADGTDLLMVAARANQSETTAYLLEQGLSVKARNREGLTALMLSNRPHVQSLLLAHGAEINAQDQDGATALMLMASRSYLDAVTKLLHSGAAVNVRKRDGATALIAAVRAEKLFLDHTYAVVRVLLDHGADPGLRDQAGKTALDYAREKGRADVVDLLVNYRR